MHIPTLISRKRDGHELSAEEIQHLIAGFTAQEIPDYQMAAWAMAVFFKGQTTAETTALTEAMIASGSRFTWDKSDPRPVVDKHSTGGIGDKVSLILAPLLAATGHRVPMVSGRGLGITGGTLDKLESIPGFRTDLSFERAAELLDQHGLFLMGQTDDFCPADKRLYALRDVTATVPSIALITASIMSKKLAEGLDRLILDVKFGTGAFMQTREEAETLADAMVAAGKGNGVDTHAVLTPMSEPLGRAVGNFPEVRESFDCLAGKGPADLEKLVLDLCEPIANCSREELKAALLDGRATQKFLDLAEAQGAKLDELHTLLESDTPPGTTVTLVPSQASGTVTKVDAGKVGQLVLELGAGRAKSTDPVHPFVGLEELVKSGTEIKHGEPLAKLIARNETEADRAAKLLTEAIEIQ